MSVSDKDGAGLTLGFDHVVVYRSLAVQTLTPSQFNALLIEARIRNLSLGVTGLLVHDFKRFWQYLEGQPKPLEQVFTSIKRDRRHSAIEVIEAGPIYMRNFADFEMGELDVTKLDNNSPLRRDFEALFSSIGHQAKAPFADRLMKHFSATSRG